VRPPNPTPTQPHAGWPFLILPCRNLRASFVSVLALSFRDQRAFANIFKFPPHRTLLKIPSGEAAPKTAGKDLLARTLPRMAAHGVPGPGALPALVGMLAEVGAADFPQRRALMPFSLRRVSCAKRSTPVCL